jgi:hypothetical protein
MYVILVISLWVYNLKTLIMRGMMYNYENERQAIFTDGGQKAFLRIRDNVLRMLNRSGAVMMGNAISGESGSVWFMMACVDRMVELGEIREVTGNDVAGQERVFVLKSLKW